MRVGESVTLDLDNIVEGEHRELYLNDAHRAAQKDLSLAAGLFVRLHQKLDAVEGVKDIHVIWNHYVDSIACLIELNNGDAVVEFDIDKLYEVRTWAKWQFVDIFVNQMEAAVLEALR